MVMVIYGYLSGKYSYIINYTDDTSILQKLM